MTEAIKEFFKDNKIEYYAVGAYSDFTETRPDIAKRQGFAARSVLIYLLPYYTGEGENISSYAVSRDYHLEIERINNSLLDLLSLYFPKANFRGYGDKSPLDEREAAALMGLGVMGENRLLINEKYGSYVFIGEVVCDIAPESIGARVPSAPISCIHCGVCKRSCPTGALRGEGVCVSEITQKKGELSKEEKEVIKRCGSVWGCDVCQRVCPMNKGKEASPVEFFWQDRLTSLTSDAISSMPEEKFTERAYSWRKKATLMRNLLITEEDKN